MTGELSIDLVMLFYVLDRFVTDITEHFLTFDAIQSVLGSFFHVNSLAARTQSTQLCVDEWVTFDTHILLDKFLIDFQRLEMGLVITALRIFFEMLLSFGWS